jgi:MFS transporter, PPP family, 3-phenylpropionic acid transporter
MYYLGYWGITGAYLNFVNLHLDHIGLTSRTIGLVSALVPLCAITLSPAISARADRQSGHVASIRALLILTAVALIALSLTNTVGLVIAACALLAATATAAQPLADGSIARMGARHNIEFGRMRLWGGVGFSITAAAAGFAWSRIGYTWMFIFCGVAMAAFATSARLIEQTQHADTAHHVPIAGAMHDTGLLACLAICLCVGIGWGLSTPFLGLHIKHIGGTSTHVGLWYSLVGLGSIPTMRFHHRIAHQLTAAGALALGCTSMALNYTCVTLITDPSWLVLTAPLEGVGFALFLVGTIQLIDRRSTSEHVSTLQSVRHGLTYGLAPLVAGPIGGIIYTNHQRTVFATTTATMLAAATIAATAHRHLNQPPGPV